MSDVIEFDLKVRCIELALELYKDRGVEPDDVVSAARAFLKFAAEPQLRPALTGEPTIIQNITIQSPRGDE